MKYRNLIIILGFVILVTHSLGFPEGVRNALYILSGGLIIALGYLSDKKVSRPAQETSSTISPQP
jgi:hypothetical protein